LWKKVKRWVRTIVSIVVAAVIVVFAPEFIPALSGGGFWAAVGTGALAGAASGAIMTGSLKGALQGALFGAIGAGVAFGVAEVAGHLAGVGSLEAHAASLLKTGLNKLTAIKTMLHGLSRGIISRLQGGSFKEGLLSGLSSAFDVGSKGYGGFVGRTVIMAVVGGTASAIGGGKFANGAVSAAFVMMYNEWAHQVKKYTLGIHSTVSSKASFTAGHAWISITNNQTGEFHTYGLWADRTGLGSNGSGGVRMDLELIKAYPFTSNYFVQISQSQYDAIASMLGADTNSWWITYTCADYARDVFYQATGRYLDVDDYLGIETPRELARSIGN
jgi:hypothetical protein